MGLVAPTLPDSDQQKTAFGAYWQTGVFALRLNLGSTSFPVISAIFVIIPQIWLKINFERQKLPPIYWRISIKFSKLVELINGFLQVR